MHHCSVSQFRVCMHRLLQLSNGEWCSCAQTLYLLLFTVYLHCVVSWCHSFRENNDNYPFSILPPPHAFLSEAGRWFRLCGIFYEPR